MKTCQQQPARLVGKQLRQRIAAVATLFLVPELHAHRVAMHCSSSLCLRYTDTALSTHSTATAAAAKISVFYYGMCLRRMMHALDTTLSTHCKTGLPCCQQLESASVLTEHQPQHS
jgi:hypothetical protein